MRRALVPLLALAAALAACSVDVEGAKCTVAGSTAECPSGQACGMGGTCSVRAASCATKPCKVDDKKCSIDAKSVQTCTAADPVCGTWAPATPCQAGVQTCQLPAGVPTCVNVEGASCATTGSTAGCPADQACGTGLTCSFRAATCAPCVAGTRSCQAGSSDVMTCTASVDPACGTFMVASGDACAAGQACRPLPAADNPTCVCDSWTVVPGAADGTCVRSSIHAAIVEAVKFPAPVVHLGGASPATYGNELLDAAPIVIPAGVTLIGDDGSPAAATNQVIAVQGPGPEGLQVHPGATIQGVAVQRGDLAGPTVGVLLVGGAAAGGNTLVSVRVDAGGAGGPFATGLRVAGANAVAVSDVLVKGATVAGLEVNRLDATDIVLVSGSTFDGNQVGVSLLKGDLTLAGSTVKSSLAEGVNSATGLTGLTIQDGLVSWNGTSGVVISTNDKLVIQRTRVCGNTGSNRGPSGQTRKVGGVFAQGSPPAALTFAGNWIHDNGGDQIYVINAAFASTWNLSGAAGCAVADRNVFANYTAPGVGVAADSASVSALFNYWGNAFPMVNTDYTASGPVDAGTQLGNSNYCSHSTLADLNCPTP